MKGTQKKFGGPWTQRKLEILREYLQAYAIIMSKKQFRFAYIDAFAGTGYREAKKSELEGSLFPKGAYDKPSEQFLEGSAHIALQVTPRFDKYIFVEKKRKSARELETLKKKFPAYAKDIAIVIQDANTYLKDLCENHKWSSHRAVLFLDPFGMNVSWEAVKAIGATRAIDLWLLFPIGAVNRLLRRDGQIEPAWKERLRYVFGEDAWKKVFYRQSRQTSFLPGTEIEKTADFDAICRYVIRRLGTVFEGVAENPTILRNSRNVPLFLLCFAAGNVKGARTAVKIAQDILGKIRS